MAAQPMPEARTIGVLEGTGFGGSGAVMLPEAALAWARAAEPGDELVYAIGHLPGWSATPKRLRQLDELGLLFCFHDRSQNPKHYVARRTAKPWCEAPRAPRIARVVAANGEPKARLLRVLQAAAKAGRPCPYNRDLAIAANLPDGDRASYLLKLLVKDGKILNEPSIWAPGRRVTIVATGARTHVSEGVRR